MAALNSIPEPQQWLVQLTRRLAGLRSGQRCVIVFERTAEGATWQVYEAMSGQEGCRG